MTELERKILEEEFYKFLKEVYESAEKEEDVDKKVLRSYAWLGLQCLFEMKKLCLIIEERDKKLLKAIKELNQEIKKLNENFEKIVTKQEKIDYWIDHINTKINAVIKELETKD